MIYLLRRSASSGGSAGGRWGHPASPLRPSIKLTEYLCAYLAGLLSLWTGFRGLRP